MEDENGIELSLGLSFGGSSSKSKAKDVCLDSKSGEGNRSKSMGGNFSVTEASFKPFLPVTAVNLDNNGPQQRTDLVKHQHENFWTDLGQLSSVDAETHRFPELWPSNNKTSDVDAEKSALKRKLPFPEINLQKKQEKGVDHVAAHGKGPTGVTFRNHVSLTTEDGSSGENEDVAESEAEGSSSWLASHHEEKARSLGISKVHDKHVPDVSPARKIAASVEGHAAAAALEREQQDKGKVVAQGSKHSERRKRRADRSGRDSPRAAKKSTTSRDAPLVASPAPSQEPESPSAASTGLSYPFGDTGTHMSQEYGHEPWRPETGVFADDSLEDSRTCMRLARGMAIPMAEDELRELSSVGLSLQCVRHVVQATVICAALARRLAHVQQKLMDVDEVADHLAAGKVASVRRDLEANVDALIGVNVRLRADLDGQKEMTRMAVEAQKKAERASEQAREEAESLKTQLQKKEKELAEMVAQLEKEREEERRAHVEAMSAVEADLEAKSKEADDIARVAVETFKAGPEYAEAMLDVGASAAATMFDLGLAIAQRDCPGTNLTGHGFPDEDEGNQLLDWWNKLKTDGLPAVSKDAAVTPDHAYSPPATPGNSLLVDIEGRGC